MRIQPISTNQQQTSFQAMKLPRLRVKPRVPKLPKQEQMNDSGRHMLQGIITAAALCMAMLTTGLIRACQSKHAQPVEVEVPAKPVNYAYSANTYEIK